MADDWQRWLDDDEAKSYQCRHLLPAPGPEVVAKWAKWLCEEREKLALARGMLYSVKFGDYTEEELESVLKETEG